MQISNLTSHWNNQPTIVKTIFTQFNNPYFDNIFVRNLEYLKNKSEEISFDNMKWVLNPMQYCQDTYNEQYLYPIIYLVNNIGSMFEFNPIRLENIIITPSYESIETIAKK